MTRHVTDEYVEEHAEICKMFANPRRLRILECLREEEKCVTAISDETGLHQPIVSSHLRKLRNRGIVRNRDEGRNTYYGIADDRIIEVLDLSREVLQNRRDFRP